MIICQGKCENESRVERTYYNKGRKRCSRCDVVIETIEIRCYCCKGVLRTGPKAKNNKIIVEKTSVRIE